MDRKGSVNNYIYSNNHIVRLTFTNHIDRIQLSIENQDGHYGQIKASFTQAFGKPVITKSDGGSRIINTYTYEGKKIQLVYYCGSKSYFFSVLIHDADQERQSLIRDILLSVINSPSCIHISQIEFTWDFYPKNPADIMPLWETFTKHIYLKNSRLGGFGYKKTTHYQGNHGNVRDGSKGLRCYPKQNSTGEFLRVEVQTNHYAIKRDLKLNILNLPIDPSLVRFGRYLEFRLWHDQKGRYLIAREIDEAEQRKTGASKLPRNPRSLAHVVRQDFMVRKLSGNGDEKGKDVWGEPSVAQQISGFKELKKKRLTKYPLKHFFPKIILLRMRAVEPKTGYLRVPS